MARHRRIATIGTGYFSQFHHDAWTRIDGAELAAVCDLDSESAEATARKYGATASYCDARDMLDTVRPDLIDIITPPPAHLEFIREAAARRIDVICQKPFCGSLSQAEEAVRIAHKAGILLVVHENFRFQPWYGQIRRRLDSGDLGDLYQISFRLRPGDGQGPRAYLDRQPYFQNMERFLVHETAIHLIDVFRYLMGEATRVFASLSRLNPIIVGEDAGVILLDFKDGPRGLFDGNRLADHPAENHRLTMGEMLIEGSRATLRLDGDGRIFLRAHGSNRESEFSYAWRNSGFGGDSVYRLQRHVVDHLAGTGTIMNTGSEYLRNLRIEEAVYESDAAGRWIELDRSGS